MDQASKDVIDCAIVQKNPVKIDTITGLKYTSRIKLDGNTFILEDLGKKISRDDVARVRHAGVGFH